MLLLRFLGRIASMLCIACGLSLQTSHVAWSACLCVCWARGGPVQNGWTDWDAFRRPNSCGSNEPRITSGSTSSMGGGTFDGGNMPAHCNVPSTAYTYVHCAHCRRMCLTSARCEGWQDGDVALFNYFEHLFLSLSAFLKWQRLKFHYASIYKLSNCR